MFGLPISVEGVVLALSSIGQLIDRLSSKPARVHCYKKIRCFYLSTILAVFCKKKALYKVVAINILYN